MKVIFLQDVKNQGKRGQIKEVPDGYANNFLIKNKKAVYASPENISKLNGQQNLEAKKAAEILEEAKQLKNKLASTKTIVQFSEHVGPDGRLNGSVTAKEIADQLAKQFNLTVDKRKLQLPQPIKTIGLHEVPAKLHTQVSAMIKVNVSELN
ncbi:50S ribosomal protein L9 [Oenococcus oeni]|uniref:Large ribosomal subunit protein bL9 n=22 Tax=Oenococcus oeni TaxID=1247 RepID=RL9_OENOB|nr:50S ribosomal protein L9 [Oenococcus oeni]Q04HQ3.1 RecName: Full=Large ribosomal subunit protein bL9; AltName: Full=50S ribosomal protein L9 [Oenococcus oeni PSU-1]EAV39060.1 50S ribosomal protein L9 [Oenococcus oeni ATCC BAA-1163]KGO16829.1 50S ribosomal protein L9 [Oenococcus oeni X2L]ABJ56019.1 LSU ribosomal protein L9P [Oenococcus oeni PSU-1]AVI93358.1 50S ribosomal protein L9 [Oenococcus oeni]AWW98765.1 50S ribosomal protein L9 [Oenococcus oeni]